MYLLYWNETSGFHAVEKCMFGERILVFFKKSTVRYAPLSDNLTVVYFMDEDFCNH